MSSSSHKKGKTQHQKNNSSTSLNTKATAKTVKEESFLSYLKDHKENRLYLIAGLLINLVLFIAYKYFYPLPDFFSDAQGYIHAAANDTKVFYRPFGYSRFLQLVHDFTSSHYFTVFLQYFINLIASLFCFFSIDYLFRFRNKKIKMLSWLLMVINPFFLVLANQIVSDALFSGLTITWITLLIWSFKRRQWWSLIVQVIILYWAFQVRYNAIYYPFLASFVFLLAPGMRLPYRIAGMAASVLVVFSAYTHIKNENFNVTGADVFAGFSGWQMANNALLIYKHVSVATEDFDDPELQLLDQFVKQFIDSLPDEDKKRIAQGDFTTGAFLWSPNSPLKKYAFYYSEQNRIPYLMTWYRVSELYNRYGLEIIKNNPGAYSRHFLLNNIGFYLVPPSEFMERYDLTGSELAPTTQEWLQIKEKKLYSRFPTLQSYIIAGYPWLHLLLVILAFGLPLIYIIRNKKEGLRQNYSLLFPAIFWLALLCANIAFSVLAAVVVLRYEASFFVLAWGLPLFFLDAVLLKKQGNVTEDTSDVLPERKK